MKKLLFCSLLLTQAVYGQNIPTLDELGSDWLEVSGMRNFPSATNFVGGLQSTENLTGFQNMSFPPFAQGRMTPFSWDLGLNSPLLPEAKKELGECALFLDGKPVNALLSKWLPYEIERKAASDGLELHSYLRLPFEEMGVMERLVVENTTSEAKTFTLSMDCTGRVRSYPAGAWRTWSSPRPEDAKFAATAANGGKDLVISDAKSQAFQAISFAKTGYQFEVEGEKAVARWTLRLAPHEKKIIEWSCAVAATEAAAISQADGQASHFQEAFAAAKSKWEGRWQASFVPGNTHFSGHFPTLVTNDQRIRRVYYEGALAALLLCRTNLPLDSRCFVTAGPQWANTIVYFWDTEMWANTWAMLEPRSMKKQLAKWLTMDFHRCYAVDCMSGGGAGPWYAANDWSVFRCVEAYVSVTGDTAFLREGIGGKSVVQHLDDIATYYESRPMGKASPLANYGGPENLLECSPSYIEGVPSLNAANVYMLRKAAAYCDATGNATRAAALRAKADNLLPAVLALYEPGQGVWSAMDTAGHKVPIRHCFDYIVIGQALEHDLSDQVKTEMNHFVQSELMTKTWMRAMSLKDPAAEKSNRPDHGPLGSYDAWPSMTMDVMCRSGNFKDAVAFLQATEAVTHLGPFAQSHEFVGPDSLGYNPIVKTASRGGQDADEGCGASFAEVIMRAFFGFRADLSTDHPVLLMPDTPRGFAGELRNVEWKQKRYTIVSDAKGVHWNAQ